MRTRLKKLLVGVSAIAALAFGAAAISQAGSNPPQKSPEPAAAQERGAPENSAADTDNVQDENGKDDASEKGEADEKGESASDGSEVPDDDGPGGHADEPANPNANHQFQGAE